MDKQNSNLSARVRKLVYAALAAAIVFTVTRIIVIPVTTSGAYVNFGDIAIYMASYLLGGPIAAAAAAVGSALADLTAGAAIYAPATFVIKGLMALTAGAIMKNKGFVPYALACIAGGAIMALGYGLYEVFVFGLAVAVGNAPSNLIQWGASVAAALILFPAARRIFMLAPFKELNR